MKAYCLDPVRDGKDRLCSGITAAFLPVPADSEDDMNGNQERLRVRSLPQHTLTLLKP